ncbi:MAG: hypothetical protein LBD85_03495 [Oscillospiraceae bacterium]|nr:hypothetical protein [Oscillospiraceae bacterium]
MNTLTRGILVALKPELDTLRRVQLNTAAQKFVGGLNAFRMPRVLPRPTSIQRFLNLNAISFLSG